MHSPRNRKAALFGSAAFLLRGGLLREVRCRVPESQIC